MFLLGSQLFWPTALIIVWHINKSSYSNTIEIVKFVLLLLRRLSFCFSGVPSGVKIFFQTVFQPLLDLAPVAPRTC